MASLIIKTSGPYTSIQDKGRFGYQALGVPEGGAVDPPAHVTANWLVGNPADAPGFEIFIGGFSLQTDTALAVALSGSMSDQLLVTDHTGEKRTEPAGQTIYLQAGDTITVAALRNTNLAFLAVSAQFDLNCVFGSVSTSANAQIGGLDGKTLQSGNIIRLKDTISKPDKRKLNSDMIDLFKTTEQFRMVLGPQDFCFDTQEIDKLINSDWQLTTRMDRMGLRLSGPALRHKNSADILSDGIVKGAIQVPGDGQPIILMADHQTTGGYTKIATVISADLPKLIRLAPHRTIRFSTVSQEEAEQIARQQANLIHKALA